MSIEPEELTKLVKQFDQQGISVQFHAIGSQSIEHVVEALEAAAEAMDLGVNWTSPFQYQ